MSMTIKKAIEILQIEHDTSFPHSEPDFYQALVLGIEALKRHQECKDRTRKGMLMPLPGETEEVKNGL